MASICLWTAYLALDAIIGTIEWLPASSTAINPQAIGPLVGALVADMAMLIFMLVMQTGRNWARIVLAVCGSLRLLLGLLVLIASVLNSSTPYISLLLLLLTVAIVTMFMPAANGWFTLSGQAGERPGSAPNNAMPFCSSCGNRIEAFSSFCKYCGGGLSGKC